MLTAELKRPGELTACEEGAWRAFCGATPAFQSPLMGPEFARAVGRVRDDAAVAIYRRAGRPIGFLAHHRRPGGLARPIGAPFSDRHAVITAPEPGLDGAALLRAAGLNAFKFTGLIDPAHLFTHAATGGGRCHLIELDGAPEDHLEAVRAASPKKFKNYRRLEHKLEREVGEIALIGPDRSPDAFDLLLAWKREQLWRTGLLDFLRSDWTRGLMESLFHTTDGEMQGMLITLRAGGRMVAGHFGVREGDAFHPWIAATDPRLAGYSPGHIFLQRAIRAMPGLGLRTYDLSSGHDHYKAQYATGHLDIREGAAFAPAGSIRLGTRAQALMLAAVVTLSGPFSGAVQRVNRRLEHIAAVELTFGGRMMGVVDSIAGASRRSAYLANAAEAQA
jgi:CelD/BcsL family acetyltransferase involved in cellulose biosynthesis